MVDRRFKRYCFTPHGQREKCETDLAGNSFVSIPNCRERDLSLSLTLYLPFPSSFPFVLQHIPCTDRLVNGTKDIMCNILNKRLL